jgi:hypothetical protein
LQKEHYHEKAVFLLAAAVFAGSGPVLALADAACGSKAERIAEVYNELQLSGTIEKIDYKKGLVTHDQENRLPEGGAKPRHQSRRRNAQLPADGARRA